MSYHGDQAAPLLVCHAFTIGPTRLVTPETDFQGPTLLASWLCLHVV
jgi:hypothetical protein